MSLPNIRTAILIVTGLTTAHGDSVLADDWLPEPLPNLEGKILTVQGPIDPAELGVTLMHEHIFINFQTPVPDLTLSEVPITLKNLYATRAHREGGAGKSYELLGDFDTALAEIMRFKYQGGDAIVDVTNIGLGRDPNALQTISRASGLKVIMGAGWYKKPHHPLNMDQLSVEDLTRVIVHDITLGAEGTSVRSGIIGEVGINGDPLTPNEIKSVRASARAARLTGAPIAFHVGGGENHDGSEKFRVLDIVESEGVDLHRVTEGHANQWANHSTFIPLMKKLLDRGVFVEFDSLGDPNGMNEWASEPILSDYKSAEAIIELIKMGYVDQIVLAHDICTKLLLRKNGGPGFGYIGEYFLPMLQRMGVSDADIHKMMVENPRKALTFSAPHPRVRLPDLTI